MTQETGMRGKEFKAFAARLSDDAIIEIADGSSYRNDWKPLKTESIRAVITPEAAVGREEAPV